MKRPGVTRLRRVVGCCAVVMTACLPALPAAGRAEPQEQPKTLRVLATYAVPAGRSAVTDVRWAGDDSVLISRMYGGVREIQLGKEPKALRQALPNPQSMQGFGNTSHLASSSGYLAVASQAGRLGWRPAATRPDASYPLETKALGDAMDIDLAGDRLLLLGYAPPRLSEATAGVAWLGSLRTGVEDWTPVLQDVAGRRMDSLLKCSVLNIGAARFLADGSFVVAPGFQPGVHLFSPRGELLRSWSSQEAGLTTDCTTMTQETADHLINDLAAQVSWYNQHRILDDILPLPQGPGLLVRSLDRGGKARWELVVLESQRITTYSVPVTGGPSERLHGDVRGGKIALLLGAAATPSRDTRDHAGRLIVTALPGR